jgi:hypothetical protein
MFSTKWIVMSLVALTSFLNLTDAANQPYVVSFICGPSGLGLARVTEAGTGIQIGTPSITPMSKTMGSTAVDKYMGYWDYGASYFVWVSIAGEAEKPPELSIIQFGEDLQPYDSHTFSKILGQYQPLHLFRINKTDIGGGGIPDSTRLFTTGNGPSGTNDYVSYLGEGGQELLRVKVR